MHLIYSLDPCLTYKKNNVTENRNHADEEDKEKDSGIISLSSNEGLLKSDNHTRGEQADEGPSRASNDWGLVIY